MNRNNYPVTTNLEEPPARSRRKPKSSAWETLSKDSHVEVVVLFWVAKCMPW